MIYGYARISTKKQSLERQIENLKNYNQDIIIFKEIYTGTKTDERVIYQRLKNKLMPGDTLVFDSVSRMSRNAGEGVKEYFDLLDKGVNLVFLKEQYINSEVYQEQAQISEALTVEDKDLNDTLIKGLREYLTRLAKKQIKIAFDQSEKEVMDLRKRTSEALQIKKITEGATLGRRPGAKIETKKAKEMKEKIKKMSKDFNGTLKDAEIIEILKIARNSYYKYKKTLKLETN